MLQNSAHTYIWPCMSVRRALSNRLKFVPCLLQKQQNSMIFSQSSSCIFEPIFFPFHHTYIVFLKWFRWNLSENSFRIVQIESAWLNFHKWEPLYLRTFLCKKTEVQMCCRGEGKNIMIVQVISCRTPNLSNGNIALFTLWNDLS